MSFIKRYFFTGLLVSAPIGATIYITIFIVEFISGLVPDQFNPNNLLPEFIGYKIPGLELLIAFLTFIFLGAIFSTLFGRSLLNYFDNLNKENLIDDLSIESVLFAAKVVNSKHPNWLNLLIPKLR